MERSLKLHKTQDCRWHQVTLEPKTARIWDFIFIFLFSYLRICTIVILILLLSPYLLQMQRKLKGAGGLTMKPKTAKIGACILTFLSS